MLFELTIKEQKTEQLAKLSFPYLLISSNIKTKTLANAYFLTYAVVFDSLNIWLCFLDL